MTGQATRHEVRSTASVAPHGGGDLHPTLKGPSRLWVARQQGTSIRNSAPQKTFLFSVIIPAYNYGRFVGRAIESALQQGGDDFEVLIVDDGSTDDTRAVVARYEDRVSYFHHTNRGQSATRNRGIDLAHGRYLIFLDADDKLLPHALAHLRREVQAHPEVGMVFGQHFAVCEQGSRVSGKLHPEMGPPMENFRDFLDRKFGICNGTAAVRRDVFDVIRFPEHIRNGEDLPVFAATLLHFPCRSVNETLLEVNAHDGRVRRNIEAIRETAEQVIDELFDPAHMPQPALRYRKLFAARKYLSMARSFYRSGHYAESRSYYRKAVATQWRRLLNSTAVARYVKSFFRQGLAKFGLDPQTRS